MNFTNPFREVLIHYLKITATTKWLVRKVQTSGTEAIFPRCGGEEKYWSVRTGTDRPEQSSLARLLSLSKHSKDMIEGFHLQAFSQ